jgi:hypothetical protein
MALRLSRLIGRPSIHFSNYVTASLMPREV